MLELWGAEMIFVLDMNRGSLSLSLDWGAEDFVEDCCSTEYEDGLFELCEVCEGEGKNEHGMPCAWCSSQPHPGFFLHEGCHDQD